MASGAASALADEAVAKGARAMVTVVLEVLGVVLDALGSRRAHVHLDVGIEDAALLVALLLGQLVAA